MPAAVAIPSAISLGTSVLGGIFGSSAASKAAKQQQESIAKAQAGITAATSEAKDNIAQGVQGANNQITTGTAAANSTLADVYNQQRGNLQPYLAAGAQGVQSLADFYKDGGEGTKQFSYNGADLENDPGYKFERDQGTEAIARRAASAGASTNGGTLASLLKYGTDYAQTKYNDAYSRALNTFQTNRTNTLSGLMSLAGIGQNATGQFNQVSGNYGDRTSTNQFQSGVATGGNILQGANSTADVGVRGAQSLADLFTQQGNSQAAGTVGSANAWTGALSGIAKGVSGAYQTQSLKDIYTGGGGVTGSMPGSAPVWSQYQAPSISRMIPTGF